MTVHLTMCSLCTLSRPEFLRTVSKLIAEHGDQLVVVEVDCMAACDDVPAVMLDYNYHAQVSPSELPELVRTMIKAHG
jgi:NADH:ubiquinone oxidoreductase subunit E